MPETKEKPTGRAAAKVAGNDLEAERLERIAERDRTQTIWERLAAPFTADEVEKLPKALRSRDDNKGRCEAQRSQDGKAGPYFSADGHYCGGWHARSVHLDYVGHAGITMRLNEVLGPEGWEHRPLAMNPEGLPHQRGDQFWATLTVTDPETGNSTTKMDVAADFSGPQEMWGDSLRRVASRFGIGTYLWSKSEKSLALKRAEDVPPPAPERQPEPQQAPTPDQGQADRTGPSNTMPAHQAILLDRLNGLSEPNQAAIRNWWPTATWHGDPLPDLERLTPDQAKAVIEQVERLEDPWATQQQTEDPWAGTREGAQDPQGAR